MGAALLAPEPQPRMGDDGEAPAPGYYAYGTTEGEGDRNDQKERHGKGTAYFANGDRSTLVYTISYSSSVYK